MTAILGISAFYHDSAAALVVDGRIIAAAQEERYSRRKHDERFPAEAIRYCLESRGLGPADLDWVVFYEKPLVKFDRLLETYIAYAPAGFRSFVASMPHWLREKLLVRRILRTQLEGVDPRRFLFAEHHESHAASAFFPSAFAEAAVLTVDGVGEWATATIGMGRDNRLELLEEIHFPHSLGLLYSAFTYYCGFQVNSGEYKLMGLAPYGEPRYAKLIYEKLIDLKDDGSFRLEMDYFHYPHRMRMISRRFERLFGRAPREPESEISTFTMDVAASIQSVTEEIMLRCARHAHRVTGARNLCLAGGVALNSVANGRILREGPFQEIWIQPAAGDAGGALGAALLAHYQLLDNPRQCAGARDAQCGSFLGPRFDDDRIERLLRSAGCEYQRFEDDDALCRAVAELIAAQKVVGWFQGRMEFGPRALGARSILADARNPTMQRVVNEKIKSRESFRPLAPAVLGSRAGEFFEMRPGQDSAYMSLVVPVAESQRVNPKREAKGLAMLDVVRSQVPAVTHVDHSARIQTVEPARHGRFHRLLEEFVARTGCPLVLNTSLNVRGEPIVCRPEEAYQCFLNTDMDALVLEHCLVLKTGQPARAGADERPAAQRPKTRCAKAATNSQLVAIEWRPDRKTLKRFALYWLAFFGLIAAPLALVAERREAFYVSTLVGVAGWLCGAIRPTWLKWPFVVLSLITFPIGWVVSHVLLGIAFYGVLTPIGVWRRLRRVERMPRRGEPDKESYWEPRKQSRGLDGYLRQF